ncbi:hypothetical protein PAT3040_05507 [Paenibacillus agaridevorans]|uniref:Uncharacterized protein n=1 Tax=Paenibacillus agaridevorans TaxID=171404 RepID=A0A2R5EX85_9BACL|nr:hypothetical protein [Paenibacillus agaridevorans]GBG10745.1 hypothetical protein PAT3040_05507 [Paenibacillus agaridevorans]
MELPVHVGLGSVPEAFRNSGGSGYGEFAGIASDIGGKLKEHGL